MLFNTLFMESMLREKNYVGDKSSKYGQSVLVQCLRFLRFRSIGGGYS